MKSLYTLSMLVVWFAALAACSEDESRTAIAPVALVNFEGENSGKHVVTGRLGISSFYTDLELGEMLFVEWADENGVQSEELSTSFDTIDYLGVLRETPEPVRLLIIGRDSSGLRVAYLEDTDADGRVEAETVLVTSTQAIEVTTATLDPDTGTLYMLDTDHSVWRATDTNSDLLPDQLQATVFADVPTGTGVGDMWHKLTLVARLGSADASGVDLLGRHGSFPLGRLEDTDADNQADTIALTLNDITQLPPPQVIGLRPHVGMSKIRVAGRWDASVQVWTVDENDENDTLLGTATIGESGAADVTLSPALSQGDRFRLHDQTNDIDGPILEVGALVIQAENPGNIRITQSAQQVLTINGSGFTSITSVDLFNACRATPSMSLSFQLVNDEELQITVPQLDTSWNGYAEFRIRSQDVETQGLANIGFYIHIP